MRILAAVLFVSLFCAGQVCAQEKVLTVDLAKNTVDISAGFTGSDLVLFGVKRGAGHVAVVIQGPKKDMVVRRKENAMGLWFNRHSLKFEDVPVYYDYALSVPADKMGKPEVLKENGIGLDALKFKPDMWRDDPAYSQSFQEGLIRNKQGEGLFPLKPKEVTFLDDDFFRATFYMPSNVPTGRYEVQSFLINNGAVKDVRTTELNVGQVGMEARIHKFARKQSFTYGVLCVALAVMAGWAANMFRRRD